MWASEFTCACRWPAYALNRWLVMPALGLPLARPCWYRFETATMVNWTGLDWLLWLLWFGVFCFGCDLKGRGRVHINMGEGLLAW